MNRSASNNASNRKLTRRRKQTGYGKAGKQNTLSNFPTATTTTKYNQLWDTESEGKITHESKKAFEVYAPWRQQLHAFSNETNSSEPPQNLLGDKLPELTEQLGRLQGVASAYDVSGVGDLLTVYIALYEQARHITKSLSFKAPDDFDLDSEISDLEVIETKLASVMDRIGIEANVRDLQYQIDVEALSANIRDVMRRYIITSAFLSLVILVFAFPGVDWVAKHLPAVPISKRWLPTILMSCTGIALFMTHRAISNQAYRRTDELRAKTKKRVAESQEWFERYHQRLNKNESNDEQ